MVGKTVFDYLTTKGPVNEQKDLYNRIIVGCIASISITTVLLGAGKQNTHSSSYATQYVASSKVEPSEKPSKLEVAVLEPIYRR